MSTVIKMTANKRSPLSGGQQPRKIVDSGHWMRKLGQFISASMFLAYLPFCYFWLEILRNIVVEIVPLVLMVTILNSFDVLPYCTILSVNIGAAQQIWRPEEHL